MGGWVSNFVVTLTNKIPFKKLLKLGVFFFFFHLKSRILINEERGRNPLDKKVTNAIIIEGRWGGSRTWWVNGWFSRRSWCPACIRLAHPGWGPFLYLSPAFCSSVYVPLPGGVCSAQAQDRPEGRGVRSLRTSFHQTRKCIYGFSSPVPAPLGEQFWGMASSALQTACVWPCCLQWWPPQVLTFLLPSLTFPPLTWASWNHLSDRPLAPKSKPRQVGSETRPIGLNPNFITSCVSLNNLFNLVAQFPHL